MNQKWVANILLSWTILLFGTRRYTQVSLKSAWAGHPEVVAIKSDVTKLALDQPLEKAKPYTSAQISSVEFNKDAISVSWKMNDGNGAFDGVYHLRTLKLRVPTYIIAATHRD